MLRALRTPALYCLGLAVAVAAGLLSMSYLQQRVSLLPGEAGCARLADIGERTDCYGKELTAQIDSRTRGSGSGRQRSLAAALQAVNERATRDMQLQGVCHQALHVTGRRDGAAAAAAGTLPTFPRVQDSLCSAGYTHGLSEGYLERSGGQQVSAVYPHLCKEAATAAGCAHGVGHSLLRTSESVAQSVRQCAALPPARLLDCTNGVFMEMGMSSPAPSPRSFARTCADQSTSDLRSSCFFYLPLTAGNAPPGGLIRLCSEHAGAQAGSCVAGVGRSLSLKDIGVCGSATSAVRADCFFGAFDIALSSKLATAAEATAACGRTEADARGMCRAALTRVEADLATASGAARAAGLQ